MPNQHTKNPRPLQERFWDKVNKNGPVPVHCPEIGQCWIWTGKRTRYGYGLLSVSHAKAIAAHRFSYELAKGPMTPGNDCCHACDNRSCVRPDHLFDGTRSANMRDAAAKGFFTCGERNGCAKLTTLQVREIRRRYAEGGITQRELAPDYNVTRAMISYVVTGHSWRHDLSVRSEPAPVDGGAVMRASASPDALLKP